MTDDIPGTRRPLPGPLDSRFRRPFPPVLPARPVRQDEDECGDEDPQALPRWAWRRRREAAAREAAELQRRRARQAAEERARRQREQVLEAGLRAAALRRRAQLMAVMAAEPHQADLDRLPGLEADREAGS
jgi:hypothetical protein